MSRWVPCSAAALALALVAGSALHVVERRQAQGALARSPATEATVNLLSADVLRVASIDMAQTLPLSGTLRAVDSAVVKAKVAGELGGLTVREGDTVKAGQVIARIDASDYESRVRQAQEQADSAAAQAEVAQRSYDNNQALVDQGFISRTALDNSLSSLNAARATHRAALAGVDMARKALGDTVVRSPIDGQVAARLVQSGERVAVDTKLVEIVDLRRIELEAVLSAAESVAVRVGQRASLQVESVGAPGTADRREREVDATVARINPSAQAGSRSVLVYLALERSEGFRQGLYAQGSLLLGRSRALAVPLAAVRVDKPEPYVQQVVDGHVHDAAVQTGRRGQADGQTFVTVAGVEEGATLLAASTGTLRDGTPVHINAVGASVAAAPARAPL
ncbi:efflux RND transporter periplasmic adaptor subunit [Variovorax sp. OV329]|uniref:efflux RND transporter periplasmic adaptor subunit n=1 Tax=Variovorax sp. OV329 TaxID=1882825 RepID=UPI0008EE5F1B|nr:efflux RND transporter periplasmic adaptor subunit [Variovorax sp. OV329]SFM94615.1 RND family efflux transporter, MFP subunit [Variovorax sp. OV329]